jgi:phosphate starvation-inducible PhoH-like protein
MSKISPTSSDNSENYEYKYLNSGKKKRKGRKQKEYLDFIEEDVGIFNIDIYYDDNEDKSIYKPEDKKENISETNSEEYSEELSLDEYDKTYEVEAYNEKQQMFIDTLKNEEDIIIFSIGQAGTGKTLISCNYAILNLLNKNYSKIVITRPIVSVDEDHGFLPGSIEKKMDPWLKPLYDIFKKNVSAETLKKMLDKEIIEICPLAYMRGRTFDNCVIIADEMQNSTVNQMKMLLTRIGKNSKMIINGDNQQSDFRYKNENNNGLKHFMDNYKISENKKGIKIIEFGLEEIERHPIIETVLRIYGEE